MPTKVEIESLVPVIHEIERCVQWAYKEFGGDRVDLPAVTVNIQTQGKKHGLCGSFKPEGFHTKEGQPVHELTVTSERLFSDVYEILGTVVHESVHLFNHDIGENDCSKGGRHNKQFRDVALQWGLDVDDPYDSRGYGHTRISRDLQHKLETKFKPDESAFRIFKETVEPTPKKPSEPKVLPWVCKCPLTVQVASKVEFDAECGICHNKFERKK